MGDQPVEELVAELSALGERLYVLQIKQAQYGPLDFPVELELDLRATRRRIDTIRAELYRRDPVTYALSPATEPSAIRMPAAEELVTELSALGERLYVLQIKQAQYGSLDLPVELELDLRATRRRIDTIRAELYRRDPATYALSPATEPSAIQMPAAERSNAQPPYTFWQRMMSDVVLRVLLVCAAVLAVLTVLLLLVL